MKSIILDPGHGGEDRANKGPTGYVEADGVLDIALKAKELLKQYVTVYMTREKDMTLNARDRVDKVNSFNGDAVISLHTNAGSSGARGTETFHSVFSQEGKGGSKLARCVHENVLEYCGRHDRGIQTRWNSAKNADYYYMIRDTEPSAIIVEFAFHSNKEEEALLKTEAFRLKCAKAVVHGVLDYFNIKHDFHDENKSYAERKSDMKMRLPDGALVNLETIIKDGRSYSENRKLLEALVYDVNWTQEETGIVPGLMPKMHYEDDKAHVIYSGHKGCSVIQLHESLPIDMDGINAGFTDGRLNPLNALVIYGKVIRRRIDRVPPRSVFVVYASGKCDILERVEDITKVANIKHAVGAGCSLIPLDQDNPEGLQSDIWASKRNRSVVGILKSGRVVLVCTKVSMTLPQLAEYMEKELKCVKALNLDGGRASQMNFEGRRLRSGEGISSGIVVV